MLCVEDWTRSGLANGDRLKVRMALHTGTVELRDGDYLGPPLNRAARLLAVGHGSQVLLSAATAQLVRDQLPAAVTLRDLGTYQLRDLSQPEPIAQLLAPDLPAVFPPLRVVGAAADSGPQLLATKLYLPRPRPDLVTRPRLYARLDAGLHAALTLVCAPAGFGKTTLIAEWLRREGHPAAWLGVDAGDSDPIVFMRYLVAMLQTVAPDVGTVVLSLLQSPQLPPLDMLMTLLLNDLVSLPQNTILVFDDYHIVTTPAIHQTLALLLDHLPPALHIIISTREDPPLPLARLRARRQIAELRAEQLRFTPDEAAAFLTEVMGLRLASADIAALEARTEGWIAGLQLAALAMQDHHDYAGFIAAFSGSNRFIVDYLADEVLARQPFHIQTFLLQTSILERMCGSLCDAVMGIEDAELRIENEPSNPFSQFSVLKFCSDPTASRSWSNSNAPICS